MLWDVYNIIKIEFLIQMMELARWNLFEFIFFKYLKEFCVLCTSVLECLISYFCFHNYFNHLSRVQFNDASLQFSFNLFLVCLHAFQNTIRLVSNQNKWEEDFLLFRLKNCANSSLLICWFLFEFSLEKTSEQFEIKDLSMNGK